MNGRERLSHALIRKSAEPSGALLRIVGEVKGEGEVHR